MCRDEEGLRKTFSCYIKNLKATPNHKTYATRDKKTARTTSQKQVNLYQN